MMPPVVRLMSFSGFMLNGEALVLWAGGFIVLQGSCAVDGWRWCLVLIGVEVAVRMECGKVWRRWVLLSGLVWPLWRGGRAVLLGQQQGLVPRVSGDGVAAACPSTSGRERWAWQRWWRRYRRRWAVLDADGVRYVFLLIHCVMMVGGDWAFCSCGCLWEFCSGYGGVSCWVFRVLLALLIFPILGSMAH